MICTCDSNKCKYIQSYYYKVFLSSVTTLDTNSVVIIEIKVHAGHRFWMFQDFDLIR